MGFIKIGRRGKVRKVKYGKQMGQSILKEILHNKVQNEYYDLGVMGKKELEVDFYKKSLLFNADMGKFFFLLHENKQFIS